MKRLCCAMLFVPLIVTGLATVALSADNKSPLTFEKHIRPIFRAYCVNCHGAGEKTEGKLDVRLVRFLVKGGESGPAIKPGDPKKSHLIERVRSGEMPPGDKNLSAMEIATLEKWIEAGAKTERPEPATIGPGLRITETERNHWAFRPPKIVPPASVKNAAWAKSDIDRYILARLEAKGLTPSAKADRDTLIRRLTYDLTGLPPTAEQIEQFRNAKSPKAYEELVDSLLKSPHFGERWGRHWLDVARYADTKGYVFQEDRNYPDAWKYRDWVVKSLNADLPFDQFVRMQIAADHQPADKRDYNAMGFLTLGRRFLNNRHDIFDDRIDVITRGLMGLTVTCARCHDHKFDAISSADYYGLYGVFASSDEPKNAPSTLRLVDSRRPHDVRVFRRGKPGNFGPVAPRQFLRVLSPEDQKPFRKGSGRGELADAIVDRSNPLTARVFVNRVWGHLFSTPLVNTPSDFGTRADPPTHPQLLDYLAVRFMQNGWSVKKLIREIVLSQSYRQKSVDRPDARAIDPENSLYWRMNRKRLDFEATRDALLVASGQLDRTIGGKPVDITKPPFSNRRTIYGFVDRQNLPGLFRTFDFAGPDTHCPKRHETSIPQQALFLLNGQFVMDQAVKMTARKDVQSATAPRERIWQLYRATVARGPAPDEVKLALQFLDAVDKPAETNVANSDSPWQYGYGEFDRKSNRLAAFHPLPHWTGSAWQGGPLLPDPKIGWVILNANGGHPGNDSKHSAVRRWTAPQDMSLSIRGRLKHPRPEGDGVNVLIVSSRTGILGEWTAHNKEVETSVRFVSVKKGETIDFITECRTNPTHDGFQWSVSLGSGRRGGRGARWSSARQFQGPQAPGLTPWQQLAQVLLMSNEFHFVD